MSSRPFHLAMYGPARLDCDGRTVKLQRKSLALLYLLALEGPVRRERAADLLWGHAHAMRNLRVELHALRRAFQAHGTLVFEDAEDPLRLPDAIGVDRTRGGGDALEGLDDLSPEFQMWLQEVRERAERAERREPVFGDLVAGLVRAIRLPYLLVLEGLPFSGRHDLARHLATRMDLPFSVGPGSGGRGVRFVPEDTTFSMELVETIREDRHSLWVIERSAFGEDPRLLLALRESYPADRTRYLRMPRLDWHAAHARRLRELPFDEAARIYLASGGLVGYVDELLARRPERGFGAEVPVPQRVRARFQLEARRLSIDARFALERLSVQAGSIPDALVEALGAEAYLAELERRRWLRFDGAWRFASDTVRRVIYDGLHEGQRTRYHADAERCLAHLGCEAEAALHHRLANGDLPSSLPKGPNVVATDPGAAARATAAQGEGALTPERMEGAVHWVEGRLWWQRLAGERQAGTVHFELPPGRQLVRVHGRVYTDEPAAAGPAREVLTLLPAATEDRPVALVAGAERGVRSDGTLVVRGDGAIDLWFLLGAGGGLTVASHDGAGMVATLALERATVAGPGVKRSRMVLAHDLTGVRAAVAS